MHELSWSAPFHYIAKNYIQCTIMYFCFSFDLGITIRRLPVPGKTRVFSFEVRIFNEFNECATETSRLLFCSYFRTDTVHNRENLLCFHSS